MMEKQPVTALVGSIQKFSTEDGPGIRTTVFLKGCPLHCAWCHNPELIDFDQQLIRMPNSCIGCGYCLTHCPQGAIFLDEAHKIDVRRDLCNRCMACASFCYAQGLRAVAQAMTAQQVMEQVLQDEGFYRHTGGGMTVSGGELLSHPAFVAQLLELAAQRGVQVCLDTSGFGDTGVLLALARQEAVTHILYDMKSIDDAVHLRYTGQSNSLILDNLRQLAADPQLRGKLQMRMPLIRGVNDTPAIIGATAALYRELGLKQVTLLPYHDLGVFKARNVGRAESTPFSPPEQQRLEEIKAAFRDGAGMTVEVLGQLP